MQKTFFTALITSAISLVFVFGPNILVKSQEAASKPYSDLFDINNPFEFDLILDIRSFIKNQDSEEYMDAMIAYNNPEGERIERKVSIRARGNSRKNICYLPPIRMDFNDEDYQIDLFDNFGKVKLVSTCKVAANHEQYVIKEYLTYKIYETITDISFKTYSVKINFIDSEDKKKPFTSYSFFIEDIDDLAERNNAIEVENQGLLPVELDRQIMNYFAMYQYLISNVDWHIPNLHNVKLIKSQDHKKPLPMPIPYDMDYCGLVSTNYAIPQDRIPIESLTERYWMGNCIDEDEYQEVANIYLEHREQIISLFENCESLDKYHKTSSIKFIEQFYDLLDKGPQARNTILKNCK